MSDTDIQSNTTIDPLSQLVSKKVLDALTPNSSYLLAVSGGIDSMCMLAVVTQISAKLNLKLEIAHINHRLRKTSANEAELVRREADKRGLPFHLLEAEQPPLKVNIEAWGRKIRYAFFKKVRIDRGLDSTLTAHTLNDVVETLLIRLISNKELKTIMAKDETRKVIRPLLEVKREEIVAYVKENKVPFIEDETNLDTRFLRNKIRHKLIPFLASEFDGNIINILSKRAAALAEDHRTINELLKIYGDKLLEFEFGSKSWRQEFKRQAEHIPTGLTWRLANFIIRDKIGYDLSRAHSKKLYEFFVGRSEGIQLPGKISLKNQNGGFVMSFSDHP